MKKFLIGIVTLAMLMTFAGCSGKNEISSEKKQIVDDFARTVFEYDDDSKDYDDALETVSEYLAGKIEKEDAKSALNSAIDKMQDNYDKVKQKELSKEFSKILDENLVPSGEYVLYINARADKLSPYISSLQALKYYVDGDLSSKIIKEELEFTCDNDIKIQEAECRYEFYSINYFFGEWAENDVKYLEDTVLNKLQSFNKSESRWVFGRDEAEKEFTKALDDMEYYLKEMEKHNANSKEELDKLQRENLE